MNSDYPNLLNFGLDGKKALKKIISDSLYGSLEQAVASLALFSNPDTVKQTKNRNVFRVIRNFQNRGKYADYGDGKRVLEDDNKAPTDAFIWANKIKRSQYSDIQFCHIWRDSKSVKLYTCIANICILPAFLAKLTDSDLNIIDLLKHRIFKLYDGFHPDDNEPPVKPFYYDSLLWSKTIPPNYEVEKSCRVAMASKPRDRVTKSAKEIGWLYSDYEPDSEL